MLATLAITGGPNSDKDGVPGNQEDRRVQHVIPQTHVDAGRYECYIEVSCNGMFGLGMNGYRHQRPDVSSRGEGEWSSHGADISTSILNSQPHRYFSLAFADLVLIRSEAVALELDFEIVKQVSQSADRQHSSLSHRALRAANEMMNTFRSSDSWKTEQELQQMIRECRDIAERVLGSMGEERRRTLCTSDRDSGPDAKMWAIGHW